MWHPRPFSATLDIHTALIPFFFFVVLSVLVVGPTKPKHTFFSVTRAYLKKKKSGRMFVQAFVSRFETATAIKSVPVTYSV